MNIFKTLNYQYPNKLSINFTRNSDMDLELAKLTAILKPLITLYLIECSIAIRRYTVYCRKHRVIISLVSCTVIRCIQLAYNLQNSSVMCVLCACVQIDRYYIRVYNVYIVKHFGHDVLYY